MANPQQRRFTVRVLKQAEVDPAFKDLRHSDLQMLLAFAERFDALGWLPPMDEEKRRILAIHDVMMYPIRDDLSVYEFRSKGGRGERDPWLSIFFHVASDRTLRICGIELMDKVSRHRTTIVESMVARAIVLDKWLKRNKER